MRRRPREVRDAIVQVLEGRNSGATVHQITSEVIGMIGAVPPSSVRSYLRLNTPELFARMGRAQYALAGFEAREEPERDVADAAHFKFGRASLFLGDCNEWLARQAANSIHAIVTASNEEGEIVRLVMTMRGGDRPKSAHVEFSGVSVMPRSMWEPWLLFRKPLEGRVQDNLCKWGTGGLGASLPIGLLAT